MFTGLVQSMGEVTELNKGATSAKMIISVKDITNEIKIGDSVSINGTCLTVVEFDSSTFTVDIMTQTLNLTTIGELKIGEAVNLELATLASGRLGGHIVQGHVDGIGKVISLHPGEQWAQFDLEIPKQLMKYVVAQGSICIDGVSLTVGQLDDEHSQVTLWLIPETLAKTNLANKKTGDLVNIEVDVLAKYVERLIAKREGQ